MGHRVNRDDVADGRYDDGAEFVVMTKSHECERGMDAAVRECILVSQVHPAEQQRSSFSGGSEESPMMKL